MSKHLFVYLFIYSSISCIALYLCLNLNTPAKETHWTRDKVDFDTSCLRKDRYITVSWSEPRKGVRSNACKYILFDHDPLSFLTSVIPSKLLFTVISGLISSCS